MDQNKISELEDSYMNKMQIRANLIDPNILIARIARAGGKTEGILIPRLLRVAFSMPGELSFLIHKTYTAAMINMVPAILAGFKKPVGEKQEPMFKEGIDYVVGATKLPAHFKKPLYEVAYPKHSIVIRTGHHFQLVASDQPDSMAGRSGVHAFIEEMKHNKGEKVKTRIFPGLRGGSIQNRKSPYYQGITGISDTARVDLGEDNWFEDFEKNMSNDLINELATSAKHLNDAMVRMFYLEQLLRASKDIVEINNLKKEIWKCEHIIKMWEPIVRDQRKACTYYITASSFVNKDILGVNFFKTQFDSLTLDEFLTAICNIAPKQIVNMFFGNFKKSKHCFSDSYKYNSILQFDLKDTFKLTAGYLKYFNPKEPLILMYDPGHFSSVIVGQFNKKANELRIIKEFFVWHPKQQSDLARMIHAFFYDDSSCHRIELFYDRAGNKRREIQAKITTDAKQLKMELEVLGFRVRLQNEKQRTIFYYEHYKLALILFGEEQRNTPRVRICENECPNLVSAIHLSPLRHTDDGKIELDKTSEDKVALPYQAGLTTQLPSALTYGLFGLFQNFLPSNIKRKQTMPDNIST
jgi:hypothetical protein